MSLKKLVFTAILLLVSFAAFAQTITVKAQLKDADSGEPVGFATVSLTPAGASKASKYVLSDGEGHVTIDKVHPGKYTIKAELLGYQPWSVEMDLHKDNADLGEVKLALDSQVLDAAGVTAVGNPIEIKKDTIVYNASSFKTTENDMLVDLLKKLPGIEVSEDGSITSNGETISKITIDGKTFFLDDPQLASNNLPAKIIEKVKVVKKKSEQAEFTGIDDGEEETVIDLNVKKGMMKGVFGNVMAGFGHDLPDNMDLGEYGDWRWQGAAMVGRFTDKSQISFIANGNNTNNRGFNDLSRSMMTSMRGGGGGAGRGGGGGMGRGQGGWGTGNGISTTWMGGVNGAFDLLDDRMELSGNYLYNGSKKVVLENGIKDTYLTDGSTLRYENGQYGDDPNSVTFSQGHRFGIRLDHKFSDNTSILIQPQLNFGNGSFAERSEFTTSSLDKGLTDWSRAVKKNEGFSSTIGDNKNLSTNGFLLLRQKLGIPGRTLSFMGRWSYSTNSINGLNQSNTSTFDSEGNYLADDPINQRYFQNAKSTSLRGRLVYTEPLGKNFYLEGNYAFGWSLNKSSKNTWDSGAIEGDLLPGWGSYSREGEADNVTYSNSIRNRALTQTAGVNFAYQKDKLRAQLGFSVHPTRTTNTTVDGEKTTSYDSGWDVKYAPSAMLFYDINDNTDVRLFYRGSSAQPSTQQLLAVADNSNPLSVSFGNPTLSSYFTHRLRSDIGYTNKKTFFSLRAHIEADITQNPIVNASWYDDHAVQYSLPVNGDNSLNASLRMFLNSPILKSNFSVSWMNRIAYSKSNSYVGASGFDMSPFLNDDGSLIYRNDAGTGFFDVHKDLDHDDAFTNSIIRSLTLVERVRLTYRSDNLEVTASARTRMNKPWYTINTTTANTTWNNQLEATLNWTIAYSGVILKADFDFNWYNGYTTKQPNEYILNAEVSKLLFKKQATLALKCYDIFNQAKNLTVTDASNYHQEVRNNTLGRYIILSFTWRFGNFGKAGQQMQARYGGRGPGGPPMMR